MEDHTPRPTGLSPADATLDCNPQYRASAGSAGSSGESSAGRDYWGRVALVEGSGPELIRETEALLRGRLRLAAVILFAGFAAFIIVHVLLTDFSEPNRAAFFGFHLFTTAVLGAFSFLLCRRCAIPLRWLRFSELVIFGLPVVFLLLMQRLTVLRATEQGYVEFPTGVWLVLIYTYALFIPNTLRRAAVVIGLIAATALLSLLLMTWLHPEIAGLVTLDQKTRLPLILVFAAAAAVFGVDTIGTLRREAFEARQLGQYRLTERIGAGGMGEVYLAEHQLLKRPCVVKLIRPDQAGDLRSLARFQREVRATAKLSHWNTIEIFDYGSTQDGTFYYVMEYLPGMSLRELVERFGPMPPERAIHLLRQACDALGEAHAAGLIHRDIKPGNIFAAQRGGVYDVVKLLDFGLVKLLDYGLVKPLGDEQPMQLTTEGSITGSPLFMSPEQATGDANADARSDIYSLGAVGYYLLTGRPPFEGDRPIQVVIAHAHEQVVPPSRHREGIPADLEQVILRCLAKSPAERFQDAASLAAALAECQAADRWTRTQAAQWWQQSQQEAVV